MKNALIMLLIILSSVRPTEACDADHGQFSVPGVILDESNSRASFSVGLSARKQDDEKINYIVYSTSYTKKINDFIQVGLQVPVFSASMEGESSTFLGDIKLFGFAPFSYSYELLDSSGLYLKASIPNSGSGHEKGHTHAEGDGSFSLTAGTMSVFFLDHDFDLTANLDFSYYFPYGENASFHIVHTIPEPSPNPNSTLSTPGSLSSGFGYSAASGRAAGPAAG